MGRDKALIEIDSQPLWRRQVALLQATAPQEILLSCAEDRPIGSGEYRLIADQEDALGPLSGITAALEVCPSELLLVLAVDLPRMTIHFLQSIVEHAKQRRRGVVPALRGRSEPLVAVYPRSALEQARTCLRERSLKLTVLTERLIAEGLTETLEVSAENAPAFENWNSPEDVSAERPSRSR